jgi:predicted nucleotidyltransferase
MTKTLDDPVLDRFRHEIHAMYGDQIDRVLLFGSRARGDAGMDSDYDVAIFLKSFADRWQEFDRLAALRIRLLDDTGAFFDAKPFAAAAFSDRTPLMREIRLEGLEI